jgi:hypothetical protein
LQPFQLFWVSIPSPKQAMTLNSYTILFQTLQPFPLLESTRLINNPQFSWLQRCVMPDRSPNTSLSRSPFLTHTLSKPLSLSQPRDQANNFVSIKLTAPHRE